MLVTAMRRGDFVLSRKCRAEIRQMHRCLAALQSCSRHIRKLYDAHVECRRKRTGGQRGQKQE
jgi:hypothetical protein